MARTTFTNTRVIHRTPVLNLQLLCRAVDVEQQINIIIGMDNAESFQMGPYDSNITLSQALALVSTELRMHDTYGINKIFDEPMRLARVNHRLQV
jgi:hypothetical protein